MHSVSECIFSFRQLLNVVITKFIMELMKNYFTKKSFLLDSVGFDNLQDYFTAVWGMKEKNVLPLMAVTVSTMTTLLASFIESTLYTPALGIFILLGVTLFDIILGTSASIGIVGEDGKNKFDPFKMSRAGARCATQIVIVAILFHLNKIYPILIFKGVSDSALLLFILTTLWSAIKNANKLKWITDEQYKMLEGILDLNQFVRKFVKR